MDSLDTPSGATPQPTPIPTDLVYTTREVAELLKIDINSIRLARTTGDLPFRQLGASAQSIRYTMEDIEVLLANRARTAACRTDSGAVRSLPAPRTRHT